MTLLRFVAGFLLLALLLAAPLVGVRRIRRRLVSEDRGVDAVLTEIVLLLSMIVIVAQLLGTVGWFRLWPLIAACNVVGILIALLAGGSEHTATLAHPTDDATNDDEATDGQVGYSLRPATVVTWAAVSVLFGSWATRTVGALRHGMDSLDTMWYHLPAALRFVQDGRLTGVPPQDADSITAFYPLTGSVFHAVLLLVFDTDLLSTVVNLFWLALTLVAAARIGSVFSRPYATTLAVAVVLAGPAFVETQPGGALTDVVGLACLLIAISTMFRVPFGTLQIGRSIPVGLALGLAVGVKFSFLFPAGACAMAAAACSPRGRRIATAAVTSTAAFASGGFWFVRNIVASGSPVPTVNINFGPVHLPHVPSTLGLPLQTPLEIFDQGEKWRDFLLPGLRDAFGPAWTLILALALIGVLTVVRRGTDPHLRLLAALAVAFTAAFLVTPQYLLNGLYWPTTLRYAFPGIALALIVFAASIRVKSSHLVYAIAALVMVTQMDPTTWSVGFDGGTRFFASVTRGRALAGAGIALTVFVLGLALSYGLHRHRHVFTPLRTAAMMTAISVVVAAGIYSPYQRDRYAHTRPFPEAYAWAQHIHGSRIGVNGLLMSLKYPFAGTDRSNRVQYLAVKEPDGSIRDPRDCHEWITTLRAADVEYVAVNSAETKTGPIRWTTTIPGARSILEVPRGLASVAVFKLPSVIVDTGCPT